MSHRVALVALALGGCGFNGAHVAGSDARPGEAGIVDAPAQLDDAGLGDGAAVDAAADAAGMLVDAPAKFVARINIAGPAYTGVDHPGSWQADPGAGGICNGAKFPAPQATMHATNDSTLYHDVMFAGTLTCRVPNVPPGSYRVTLLFAEVFWGGPPCGGAATGKRVFSVALEGTPVLTNYNETMDGGGCAVGTGSGHPVDKSFVVAIADGALDVTMVATIDNAALNAIELVEQ